MKYYLKKNDNEFKDKFLLKVKDFNNVVYELKDKITNSIEVTMEKINKEMEEGQKKHEKLLKDKIEMISNYGNKNFIGMDNIQLFDIENNEINLTNSLVTK